MVEPIGYMDTMSFVRNTDIHSSPAIYIYHCPILSYERSNDSVLL